jgi:LacI family transcriptional regulator
VKARPISINDVAKECGCSIATISLALNGRGKISEKTKKRVFKAAARLGYVPNMAGRSLRSQRTNTIAVFFYPSCGQLFRNVFYADVMDGLESRLAKAGFDLLLSNSDFSDPGSRSVTLLTQRRVDAAIMLGAFPFEQVQRVSKLGVPAILLDSDLEGLSLDSVTSDGFNGSKTVVEHLVQKGHRKIVMLAYDLEDYNIDLRSRGFLAGLEEHRLPRKDAVIRNFTTNEEGLPTLLRRLRSSSPPTAVVCINDTMAVYMMQRVREAGFAVPSAVSFVGYDDDVYARDSIPQLTTLAVDKQALGRAGADLILTRLRNMSAPVSKSLIPVNLIERDSVAKLDR